jgi:tRNA U34 5-methylaminomethyl-2-thiouridine-forming methyltransferase MnmC
MGFGSGLNAYLSWLYAKKHKLTVYYETIEPYPISTEQAGLLNYPDLLQASRADFLSLHTAEWDRPVAIAPDFTLCKWSDTVQEAPINNQFDLVFYDAFAPSSQPELWEADVLRRMSDALQDGGVFVTYCAKGVVKRCLRSIGLQVEGIPGPPGKREMTRATKPVAIHRRSLS